MYLSFSEAPGRLNRKVVVAMVVMVMELYFTLYFVKRNHFLFTHAIGCYALHCIMVAMCMYYGCQVMN